MNNIEWIGDKVLYIKTAAFNDHIQKRRICSERNVWIVTNKLIVNVLQITFKVIFSGNYKFPAFDGSECVSSKQKCEEWKNKNRLSELNIPWKIQKLGIWM